ncbi:MAG: hypothetical protein IT269_14050 [Saprospiraceae bacterium]|nr:hypothetical protein [Saprospiraceae bacterium]
MENFEEPKLDPEEELRIDNELKALNLEMKHGGIVDFSDDVPPEIMSAFLTNVTMFEDQYKDAVYVSVYTFIGRPPYAQPDLLDADTLPIETERLQKLLEESNIIVNKPERISAEEWYRFIVEDVFRHEVSDIRIPGMMNVLDYDEFYPDKEELIKDAAEQVLFDLLELKHEFSGAYLSENLRDDKSLISKEAVLNNISAFRKRYAEIIPVALQPEKVFGDEDCSYFTFLIRWEGVPHNGGANEVHEGLGIMQFAYEDGDWRLQGVQMPGFKF